MGSLSGIKAHELGAVAIKEVLSRAKITTPEDIDEVILGQVGNAVSPPIHQRTPPNK